MLPVVSVFKVIALRVCVCVCVWCQINCQMNSNCNAMWFIILPINHACRKEIRICGRMCGVGVKENMTDDVVVFLFFLHGCNFVAIFCKTLHVRI